MKTMLIVWLGGWAPSLMTSAERMRGHGITVRVRATKHQTMLPAILYYSAIISVGLVKGRGGVRVRRGRANFLPRFIHIHECMW